MERDTIMWVVIVVLAIAVVYLTVQVQKVGSGAQQIGSAGSSLTGGAVDMSGWTETEKMEYEHHGTLPARLQGSAQNAQAPSMVGGC